MLQQAARASGSLAIAIAVADAISYAAVAAFAGSSYAVAYAVSAFLPLPARVFSGAAAAAVRSLYDYHAAKREVVCDNVAR